MEWRTMLTLTGQSFLGFALFAQAYLSQYLNLLRYMLENVMFQDIKVNIKLILRQV